jgi:hypothetical protein
MFHTKFVEAIKIHVLCPIAFFFLENSTVYEIMWKTTVQPDEPHMTIWRMRIARWITKAIYAHSEYVILFAFSTATMVARTRLSVNCLVNSYSWLLFRLFSSLINVLLEIQYYHLHKRAMYSERNKYC